jgi:Concanavalin A-like lectin/glucanases superfamily
MAIDFDGVDNWIDLRAGGPTLDAVNGDAASTICGWTRCDTQVGSNLMSYSINNGGAATNTQRFSLDRNAGGVNVSRSRAGDGAGQLTQTDPGAALVNGQYYHLAAMVNVAGDTGALYRDGVQTISAALAFVPAAFDATGSASGGLASDPAGADFTDGLLEDWRVYARVLTPDMIGTIEACRGHDGIWDTIRARYPMNEFSPGTDLAGGAGVVKDWSNFKRNGNDVNGSLGAESRLSLRRRYP